MALSFADLSLISAAVLLWGSYLIHYIRGASSKRYPPGPRRLPIIGNIWRIPFETPWKKMMGWKHEFGNLVYLDGFGKSVLILNSMEVINDLLDKRGKIYSHRPELFVAGELFGLNDAMVLKSPSKELTLQRKLFHSALGPDAVKRYHRMQEETASLFLCDLLNNPGQFYHHVRMATGRLIMAVAYGFTAQEADSEYIDQAERTMKLVGASMMPGAYLVDSFPILKAIFPSWLPLIKFWRDGRQGREMVNELTTKPFLRVKQLMDEGIAPPSVTQSLLSNFRIPADCTREQFEQAVKMTTASIYAAGSETTYGTIIIFIMLMVKNPEKQKIARNEILNVIGHDRLPTAADIVHLPYMQAVIKKTMRWQTVVPLSIPRRLAEDDIYNGYFIPAGTTILPNIWSLSQNMNDSSETEAFIPERFLGNRNELLDPHEYVFGFGRRICPGRWFAESSVLIVAASLLTCFEITSALDDSGNPVPIKPLYVPGVIYYPSAFKCNIKPLDKDKELIIRSRLTSRNL